MVKTKGLSLRGPKGAVAISQYPVGSLETPGEIVIACGEIATSLRSSQ